MIQSMIESIDFGGKSKKIKALEPRGQLWVWDMGYSQKTVFETHLSRCQLSDLNPFPLPGLASLGLGDGDNATYPLEGCKTS
jgi:hypothetical protein